MKKNILILLIACALISCGGMDEYGCKESVMEKYPNALAILKPTDEDWKWKWVVIDQDGFVYYVETMNTGNTDITKTELMYQFDCPSIDQQWQGKRIETIRHY